MTFTVTYRGADGALAEERVEAADRAACVAACRARGISPMRIEAERSSAARTGAGRQGGGAPGGRVLPGRAALVAGGVLLAAALGGAWWWMGRGKDEPAAVTLLKAKSVKNDVGNVKTNKDVANTNDTNAIKDSQAALPVVQPPPPPPPRTNDVGRVVTNAFGKAFRIDAVVVPRGPRRNGEVAYRDRRLFESNAENTLDGIVNQAMGDRLLGDFDEKQFEKEFLLAMNSKIEFSEEDNEDEVRRKMEMIDMKKELLAAHDRGESIGAIVKAARDEIGKAADLRDALAAELVDVKKSSASPEEIEEYYAAANRILAERGVRPFYSPATIRQKLQAAKQRKLAEKETRR